MKMGKRALLAAACVLLVAISWITAIGAKSDSDKQAELLDKAGYYLADEVYIRAIPLLEEAAGYNGEYTLTCEAKLKECYLALIDQSGYRRRYTDLLERQMGREDASPEVFEEAARFYMDRRDLQEALAVLRQGAAQTQSPELTKLYEDNRYAYSFGRSAYDEVTGAVGGTIQVKRDGLWGLASADGELMIPCVYDKISTCGGDRVIVRKGSVISAVNLDNNRLALLHEPASDFGNLQENRTSLLLADGWHLATGEFAIGSAVYEAIGTYSGQYAAAKQQGRWGVIDLSGEWSIPAEYDGVVMDETGRCWGQSRVFVRQGNQVLLLADGKPLGEPYEDAKPFSSGYAAVKRGGRWGFIDANGEVKIDFQFDDALSFSQHLAAVQVGNSWGYISLSGKVVIEPAFLEARGFYNGSAPIRTVDGWEFIHLLEY